MKNEDDKSSKKRAARGGRARAEALTPEERSAIAAAGARARWGEPDALPKETHTGSLPLGAVTVTCSVLSNGMRVISQNSVERALGSGVRGKRVRGDLPAVLSATNLTPFISDELRARLADPVRYAALNGGRSGMGFEADVLADMCEVLLDARGAGALRKSQLHIAAAAELLMRAFSRVGLVALIDEATGYQAERQRNELHRILEAYIAKELLPWTKRFPDDFFREVYRIHGWKYDPAHTQRPGYVGKFINRFVYEALPDGVLEELRERNPTTSSGRRRYRHFQFLSEETGNPHLDRQIVAVTTAMRLASDKAQFKVNFKRLHPKKGEQLDLMDDMTPATSFEEVVADGLTDVRASASAKALWLMRGGNTIPTRAVAEGVYGDGKESTMNKARKLLSRLKGQGLVESPSPGLWKRVE